MGKGEDIFWPWLVYSSLDQFHTRGHKMRFRNLYQGYKTEEPRVKCVGDYILGC